MGGDVDRAPALHARVEVPPRAAERDTVDALLEVVHALLLDGRRGAGVEAAEERGVVHQPLHQPRDGVAPPRHHLAHERPAREARADRGEVPRRHQPGLVGQDVQAGRVEGLDHAGLAAVAAGQHHQVAGALGQEPRERVGGEADAWTPGGRPLRAAVEAVDQGQEVVQLGPRGGVDEDLGGHGGAALAQSQGGVEVAGVEEGEGVHVDEPSVLWAGSPMTGTGRALSRYLPAAALFAALLAAWQLAVSGLGLREYLLPAPMRVIQAMLGDEIPWPRHVGVTALEIGGAFVVAGAVGVALGVAVAWSPLLSRALVPFLVFVNTLPKVAVAPLFLLWLGYGVVPNMLIGALIGFFPVVINTAVGLSQVDEELLDLGASSTRRSGRSSRPSASPTPIPTSSARSR